MMIHVRIFLLFCLFMPLFVYTTDTTNQNAASQEVLSHLEGVRGYTFGEKLSHVLNTEHTQKEYALIPSLTNNNRLVYKGDLFNKAVQLVYIFQEGRLVSLSYFWFLEDMQNTFYNYLTELLTTKYGKATTRNIPTLGGHFQLDSYTKYSTNNTTNTTLSNPTTSIDLEIIDITNTKPSKKGYILEFRAYDTDNTVETQILTEDL